MSLCVSLSVSVLLSFSVSLFVSVSVSLCQSVGVSTQDSLTHPDEDCDFGSVRSKDLSRRPLQCPELMVPFVKCPGS